MGEPRIIGNGFFDDLIKGIQEGRVRITNKEDFLGNDDTKMTKITLELEE